MLIPISLENLDKPARFVQATLACALLLLLFLMLVAPHPAHAQGAGNWRTYTTEDGLLSNNIQALAYREDPLDFPPCDRTTRTGCPAIPGLWGGTDKGLTYHNGRDHVNFVDHLPAPDVRDLLFAADSKLWIATNGGLTRLDDNRTPQDFTDDQWLNQVALPRLAVRTLTQTAAEQLWAGTNAGLYRLDASSGVAVATYLPDRNITALPRCPLPLAATCTVAADGQLWIGTASGLFRLSLHEPQTPPVAVTLPLTLTGPLTATTPLTITALTVTPDGLWVGTNKGAAHWNGQVWDTLFDGTGNLASRDVRAIAVDDQGYVWFATARGAARWRPVYHTWQHFFADREPLPSDDILSLLIEPHGAVWLGTATGVSGTDGAWTLLNHATTYDYTGLTDGTGGRIIKDSQGRMWVETEAGVSVFDGSLALLKSFTQANGALPDNNVYRLVEDRQGRMWVGTEGGVNVFDGSLALLKSFAQANGALQGNSVRTLVEDRQGRMWVGTDGGVSVFDGSLTLLKSFTQADGVLGIDSLSELVEDRQGLMWVGTKGGVSVFDGSLTLLKSFTQANGALPSNSVSTLVEDRQGRMWVGTEAGVSVFDGGLALLKSFTQADDALPVNDVYTLVEDRQGHMWVGTYRDGVSVFDSSLALLKSFSRSDGPLPASDVRMLVEDRQGRMWVGTSDFSSGAGGGVSVFDGSLALLKSFTQADGALPDNNVSMLVEDRQGRMWVVTYRDGVSVFDSSLVLLKSFTGDNGALQGNSVRTLVEDRQGRMWVGIAYDGYNDGVSVFDSSLALFKSFTEAVYRLVEDRQGRMWVGTTGDGVNVFDGSLALLKSFKGNGVLPGNSVSMLVEDRQGRMWVGTAGDGVNVFDDNLALLKSFTQANGALPSNSVSILVEDSQGRMWVGTYEHENSGGVSVFDGSLTLLKSFTQANGALPTNNVSTLVEDRQGRMWVGTFGSRYGGDGRMSVFDDSLALLKTFTSDIISVPMLGRDLRTPVEDRQGRMWVGMHGGVSVFDSEHSSTPWLNLRTEDNNELENERLVDAQQVTIRLEAGSLQTPPQDLGYQVILTDTISKTTVFSTTLPPGAAGAAGFVQVTLGATTPLTYHHHVLTVAVFDRNLGSYTLPAITFDVQASPQVTLSTVDEMAVSFLKPLTGTTSVSSPLPAFLSPLPAFMSPLPAFLSPLFVKDSAPTIFSSHAPLAVEVQIVDADGAANAPPKLEYTWNYRGADQSSTWQQPLSATNTITNHIALQIATLQPPPMARGDDDRAFDLAMRVIDANGNPSPLTFVTLTFSAPPAYTRLVAPYLGALAGAVLILFSGLVMLARNSGLPVTLLAGQHPRGWLEVGLSYRRYRERWAKLTPLEQLLMLLTPTAGATPAALLRRLSNNQTPVPESRFNTGLDTLVRSQFLTQTGGLYRPLEPRCQRVLQTHIGTATRNQLAEQIRIEHPLVATARHFFTTAGFGLQPVTDPLAFLCVPTAPLWQRQITSPIYARLFPEEELAQAAVANLGAAARQAVSQPTAANPMLIFALVDHTPSDSGWIAIGALRAEGIQVVPIDDGLMQQARIEQQEQRTLQLHIRRFIGRERDLFNVRDPVADRLNFFGREQRSHDLLEALVDGRPQALLGLRKMGKSSLLQVMRERAPFAVAHIDLQAGQEPLGLYTRILQEWQQALRVRHPTLAWTPPPLTSDPTTAFTASARALLQTLAHAGLAARLGLFIDEFDLLMPRQDQLQDPALLTRYLTVTQALRGLVQETGRLALLVAGVDARFNRVNRWGEVQNSFYQFFQETYLEPLSAEDCQQMVRNIGRQMGLVFDDAAATAVARLSGGHPFLARQLCSTALTLRQSDEALLSLDLVERAAALFVRQPATAANLDEQGLWGEVTNPALWPPTQIIENQALLQTLAHAEEKAEPDLLAAGADPAARTQSLYELTQRAVLRRRIPERLRIHLELFSAWIRAYRRSEQP